MTYFFIATNNNKVQLSLTNPSDRRDASTPSRGLSKNSKAEAKNCTKLYCTKKQLFGPDDRYDLLPSAIKG